MDGEFSSVRPDGASERLVGNAAPFRNPERSSRGKRAGWHSFGYFSFATERKAKNDCYGAGGARPAKENKKHGVNIKN